MENILSEISEEINIKYDERRTYNRNFQYFINYFINEMKETSELFEYMYKRIAFVGSYWEGAKIDKPDEFDLNIVLKLPVKYEDMELNNAAKPGLLTMKIDRTEIKKLQPQRIFWKIRQWTDENNFFLPDKFRNWMYSIVNQTFNRLKKTYNSFCKQFRHISISNSGPAVTIHVQGQYQFDVDIVPVIQIPNSMWLEPPYRPNPFPNNNYLSWYLIPKPRKGINVKTKRDYIYWRPSFYDYERKLMTGKNQLKPAWRLLKKLKENLRMEKIASYHIKIVCLLELKKNINNGIWNTKSLADVFLVLLKAFQLSLKQKKIPFYWQMNDNMLKNIKIDTLRNYSDQITRVVKQIENNPQSISNYL